MNMTDDAPEAITREYIHRLETLVHRLTGDEGEDDALEVLERYIEQHAAPTSPHDVDAVRVDEAMVERAVDAYIDAWDDHVRNVERCDTDWDDSQIAAAKVGIRAALTAALRKPGDSDNG